MFFNHDVEKLRHKTELYTLWAWVSVAFSMGAIYKYIETNWSGSLVISGALLLSAFVLTRAAKKLKHERITIETKEAEEESKKVEEKQKQKKQQKDKQKEERSAVRKREAVRKKEVLKKSMSAMSKQKDEDSKFLEEVKSRSLEENLKLLNIKYKSLSNKEKIASYGEYEKSIKWLKAHYK